LKTAERLAELVVGPGGANVQPAYRRGATYVEAIDWDPYVKRARLELAEDDTLEFIPPGSGSACPC
jgi:hypothetical protein